MQITFLLVLALVLDANGFGMNFWNLQTMLRQESFLRYKERHDSSQMPNSSVTLESHVIIQPLDHFNPQVKETYGQRYLVNSVHWNKKHGPVFLYIAGEWTLSEDEADSGAILKLAKTYGALILAVEHRFYGQSLNDDALKLQNLKYLSSQQALADLANFHLQMTKVYNLTEMNKWVSFGRSYAGSLSAWFRVKYPHLVHAAIASSAPVRALVDFRGYNHVVARSLKTELVGGSQRCARMIRDAFRIVDELLSKRKLTKLSRDFLSCEPVIEDDIHQFSLHLTGIFMGLVQYNNLHPYAINIKEACQIMTLGPDAYKNLVVLNTIIMKAYRQECSDDSWKSFIQKLSKETVNGSRWYDMRQWIYQTCTQFGYYQVCEYDECLFSRYMTLSPSLNVCKTVFKLDKKEVYDRVDFTNSYYGSDHPKGSRILFVNGLIDPWHALSVLNNLTSNELAIVIPGTSHCADMLSDSPNDPPALTDARRKISEQIGLWLKEPNLEAAPTRRLSSLKKNRASLQKM